MMNTRLASAPRATRRGDVVGMVLTAVAWLVAMVLVAPALRTPAHVDRIVVDNPHPWPATIAVSEGDDAGWVGVGALGRERSQTFLGVVDQGPTWVFRFGYGREQVELVVSREQLERSGWRVTVPEEYAGVMRSAGLPEAPP